MRWTSVMTMVALLAATGAATGCSDEVTCEGDNCGDGGQDAQGGSGGTGGTVVTPADVTHLCDAFCACLGCDPAMLSDCETQMAEVQSNAEAEGCFDELAATDACIDQMTCDAGAPVFSPACDTTFNDLSDCAEGGTPPPPPPGSICDVAAAICGAVPDPGLDCSGQAACSAACIVNFDSCEFPNPSLESCLSQCN